MYDWILNNKEWVFSGIGVAVLGFFINKAIKRNLIKSGSGSTNTIVSGDVSGSVKINVGENDQTK